MDEYLRRAKESLARQRRRTVLDRARANVEKLRAMVAQAKAVHADVGDVEALLEKAEDAMRSDDLKGIDPLIDRAEASMKARVDQLLKDRYPRLFLETAHAGLQTNRWNRFEMQITNKGNWPAERVIPIVTGPVEVLGLKLIDVIEPNQKVSLEFGLKPKSPRLTRQLVANHHRRGHMKARIGYKIVETTVRGAMGKITDAKCRSHLVLQAAAALGSARLTYPCSGRGWKRFR